MGTDVFTGTVSLEGGCHRWSRLTGINTGRRNKALVMEEKFI